MSLSDQYIGKSNFIGAFFLFCMQSEKGIYKIMMRGRGSEKCCIFGAKTTKLLQIRISFGD